MKVSKLPMFYSHDFTSIEIEKVIICIMVDKT